MKRPSTIGTATQHCEIAATAPTDDRCKVRRSQKRDGEVADFGRYPGYEWVTDFGQEGGAVARSGAASRLLDAFPYREDDVRLG